MNKIILFFVCLLFTSAGAFAQLSRFRFGVSVYPNYTRLINSVFRETESGVFTMSAGAFSEYSLNPGLKFQFGLGVSGPSFLADYEDFTGTDPNDPLYPTMLSLRTTLRCVEVPFNLIWYPDPGIRLFTTVGCTSFTNYAKHFYSEITYKDGSQSGMHQLKRDFNAGVGIQLGLGTSVKLSRSVDLDIVPELKIMQLDFKSAFSTQFMQAGLKLSVKV